MDPLIPRLVLASSSPRRKMLLEQLGLYFEVVVSDIHEDLQQPLPPGQLAETLALQKAQAIAVSHPERIIIGADTIVVDDLGILGKPKDAHDASQMLARLSGNVHRVITGLALISTQSPAEIIVRHETTQVKFTTLSDQDIAWYLHTGEPLDKAGAYAIQGKGARFIEWIHGCCHNVVGLPLFLLVTMLKEISPSDSEYMIHPGSV
jgi:septum formation protein